MKVLITGGAGFVGAYLAILFNRDSHDVTCFDNLMRRGSEYNLDKFKRNNIKFIHGDIRNPEDFEKLEGTYDLLIEASAEPSVHTGNTGSPKFIIQNNLVGAINCLEFARKFCSKTVFLSSSRVYSIPSLKKIKLNSKENRFEHIVDNQIPGLTSEGINEKFPTDEYRSFYGTTKFAAECFIQEYAATYGMDIVSNRCGVLCGEGQWGKTDQGVFTLWVARHIYGGTLNFTGFGGLGHQVRDLLHPSDLYALIVKQYTAKEKHNGESYNVGGGLTGSVSLAEYTMMCNEICPIKIQIKAVKETANVDIPFYVTDNSLVSSKFNWFPKIMPKEILSRVNEWIVNNYEFLKPIFGQ